MFFLSLFSNRFLILQLVLQIHLYTSVLCLCAVSNAEGRDIPTLSRIRFSTKETSLIERYFFTSRNSFSLTVSDDSIRCKKNSILVSDAVNENEFLLAKQYLSMKGVFLVENHILDNVGMSLPSTQQTAQTQVRTCTVVFGRKTVDYKNC